MDWNQVVAWSPWHASPVDIAYVASQVFCSQICPTRRRSNPRQSLRAPLLFPIPKFVWRRRQTRHIRRGLRSTMCVVRFRVRPVLQKLPLVPKQGPFTLTLKEITAHLSDMIRIVSIPRHEIPWHKREAMRFHTLEKWQTGEARRRRLEESTRAGPCIKICGCGNGAVAVCLVACGDLEA
jgi:hypothetical protein